MVEFLEPGIFVDIFSNVTPEKLMNKVGFVFKNEDVVPNFDLLENTGFDLKISKDSTIKENTSVVCPTGCKWVAGSFYYLDIRPRSGFFKTPLIIHNAPGTIEGTYRGEIGIIFRCLPFSGVQKKMDGIIYNLSDENNEEDGKTKKKKTKSVTITKGVRAAQAVVGISTFGLLNDIKLERIYYTVSEELFEKHDEVFKTTRGDGGFGHSGTR